MKLESTDELDTKVLIDERTGQEIKDQTELDTPLLCGLTRREIEQMKTAGMAKPGFIKWPEWNGPLKLSHRHMYIADLAARGARACDIASHTNMSESRISLILNSPLMQAQIKLVRETQLKALTINEGIDQLSPLAMQTYAEILNDPRIKPSLKKAVAQDVLDRKIGKPQQRLEIGNNLVSDMFKLLQKQEEARMEAAEVKTVPGEARELVKDTEQVNQTNQPTLPIPAPAGASNETKAEPMTVNTDELEVFLEEEVKP